MADVDVATLLAILEAEYEVDPEAGTITRKVATIRWPAGRPAGYIGNYGYRILWLHGRKYLAHRVIWAVQHGEWPSMEIDHINQDRADNRIANLRLATKTQNRYNSKVRRDSQSGLRGAFKRRYGWAACITVNKVKHRLGTFRTAEEAHAAYLRAAKEMHGEHFSSGQSQRT